MLALGEQDQEQSAVLDLHVGPPSSDVLGDGREKLGDVTPKWSTHFVLGNRFDSQPTGQIEVFDIDYV